MAARLTPDQKVGSSNLSALIFAWHAQYPASPNSRRVITTTCEGWCCVLSVGYVFAHHHVWPVGTVWPSGLRRWLQAPVCKGVGSNPTAVIFVSHLLLHTCDRTPAAGFVDTLVLSVTPFRRSASRSRPFLLVSTRIP